MAIDSNENLFIKFDQILGEKEWTKAIITMIDKLGRRSSTKEISIGSVAESGKIYSNRSEANPKWLGISMFLKSVEGDMVELEIEFI
jgi:hypothetical protein